MTKKITCKTGLKKNVINKKVFDREAALCRMLSKKNKSKCGWGKCKDCGVVPLLIKLHEGKLIEGKNNINSARKKYL
ncbi:MAG: hypothetical protein WC831_00230 [Parcubacteria group bacterium]|jgi:hypothetical protein